MLTKSDKFNDLRKQAEALLPPHGEELPEMSVEAIQKLVHELETHQIELELQNKELWESRTKLEISRNEYSELFDFAPVGYFILDEKGLIIKVNLAGADMLGIERRHLIQKGFSHFIAPEFRNIYYNYQKNTAETGNMQNFEPKLLKPDGITSFYVLFKGITIKDDNGTVKRIQIAVTDIDKQKQAEMLLKEALAEKEVLLKEVHHRVKNNLQTLIYLIDMQKESVKNKEVINALYEFQGRAKSMALVHDMLYQSDNLAQIDFDVYVRELAEAQFYLMVYNRPISLQTEIADVKVSVETALPLGMIINELITNALKYAFPDNKPHDDSADPGCKIQIKFELKDDIYILTFSDNGAGIPKELDWRKTESLGLKLVNLWGGYQLMGSIETDFSSGVKFIVKFPAK